MPELKAVLTFLIGSIILIISGVFIGLITNFLTEKGGRFAKWMLTIAIKLLPNPEKERFKEEWLTEVDSITDGPLSKLYFAISIIIYLPKTISSIYGESLYRYFLYKMMTNCTFNSLNAVLEISNSSKSNEIFNKSFRNKILILRIVVSKLGVIIFGFCLFGSKIFNKKVKINVNNNLTDRIFRNSIESKSILGKNMLTMIFKRVMPDFKNLIVDTLSQKGIFVSRNPEKLADFILNVNKNVHESKTE
jgi:hypothetical protein